MPQYLSPGVYVEEMEAATRPIEGVGTAVAAFVGVASQGPYNQATLVTNWTQFTTVFGDFIEGAYLHHAVYGFFQNGGGICYVLRVGSDAAGGSSVPARAELTTGGDQKASTLKISALAAGPAGNDVSVEVVDPPQGAPDDTFKLVVKQGGKVVEEYDGLSTKRGKTYAVTVVNAQSKTIKLEEAATGQLVRPAKGTVALAGGANEDPKKTPVRPDEYLGDSAKRTGFGGLEAIDAVTMVSVPDLMSAYQQGRIDLEGVKAVQLGMIAHCELMGDRVAIVDSPPSLNAQGIRDWRIDGAGYDSKYAALYWPWVKVFDPASGTNIHVPPSGHMAGIWSRNDDARGVHKAPANEVVRGAISLELNITKGEHDLLNPHGINCIRAFPGRGIRVWGARTLSSDPAWRYLNIRRFFNYLEESIMLGTQWCVFEPNDYELWGRIRRTIAAFLVMEWRKGALFGLTPGEAFYVKCDGENNTAESIDLGQVICEIGLAPVKPAEFVIFRLSQFSGGVSLAE
ncbi:MAG: phage tail sheath subtilisin-like domain-containing protein [Acidimicrobiales bacterium]